MDRRPDYTQTLYHGWDTIGDIFHDPIIIKSLEEYKEYIDFGSGKTQGFTDGDLLHMVFDDEDKFEEFLQIMRHNPLFQTTDYPKIVTLILALNHMQEEVENTPQTIIRIFCQKVHDIIQTAKENVYGETDKTQDDLFSYFHGLDLLAAKNGFPLITSEGEIVYYHSEVEDEDDVVNVWTPRNGVMTMNREGDILSEKDDTVKLKSIQGGIKEEKNGYKKDERNEGVISMGGNLLSHKNFRKRLKKKKKKTEKGKTEAK